MRSKTQKHQQNKSSRHPAKKASPSSQGNKKRPSSKTPSNKPSNKTESPSHRRRSLVMPAALRKGDTIAVIRPAAKIDADKYKRTIDVIRDFGFFVAEFPEASKPFHYFSAEDEYRKREFCWAMQEPGIRAVLCSRAGYGSMRMVNAISKDDLKKFQCKVFAGYSDVTYLHQWLHNQLQWQTFHAPLVGMLNDKDLTHFLSQLTQLSNSQKEEDWAEVVFLQEGEASAALHGGNLSLLRTAGPAKLPEAPFILAIEEVGEEHYALDRLIWSLIDAGYSRYVKGVIVGRLHQCGEKDKESFPIRIVQDSLKRLCKGPILWGAHFGHGLDQQRLLPLGKKIKLKNKSVSYNGPLVNDFSS